MATLRLEMTGLSTVHRASIARTGRSEPVRSNPYSALTCGFSSPSSMPIHSASVRHAEVVGSNPAVPTTEVAARGHIPYTKPKPTACLLNGFLAHVLRVIGQQWHWFAAEDFPILSERFDESRFRQF